MSAFDECTDVIEKRPRKETYKRDLDTVYRVAETHRMPCVADHFSQKSHEL